MKIRYEPFITIFVLIIIWQFAVSRDLLPNFIVPSPQEVGTEIIHQIGSQSFWINCLYTSCITVVGFLFGSLLGFILGVLLYYFETLRVTLMPFLIFFQITPKIAIVPLFIIWMGLGLVSKLIIVASMVFFPIVLSTLDGLDSIPNNSKDLFTILGATKFQKLIQLEIPCSLPYIFSAMKISIVNALIGAIVAEWMGGQSGLGYIQVYASSTFNTPLLIVGIIFTIIIGLLAYYLIEAFEYLTIHWEGK